MASGDVGRRKQTKSIWKPLLSFLILSSFVSVSGGLVIMIVIVSPTPRSRGWGAVFTLLLSSPNWQRAPLVVDLQHTKHETYGCCMANVLCDADPTVRIGAGVAMLTGSSPHHERRRSTDV